MARFARMTLLAAAALVVASGCKGEFWVSIPIERGSVTADIATYTLCTVLEGDEAQCWTWDWQEPPDVGVGLSFGSSGLLEASVEAFDGASVMVGVGATSIDIPADTRDNLDAPPIVLAEPTDMDLDGVPDLLDNCPMDPNAGQEDCDGDGEGDACDADCGCCPVDMDMDGVADATDNCPAIPNPLQEDCDGDSEGDVCDSDCGCCPLDGDGDMIPDTVDNCPMDANPLQENDDADGLGNACDNCPNDDNAGQEDTVPAAGPDGIGDACGDFDLDGSGDLVDCEPEDISIFPGALDNPDGVDTDCAPMRSSYDLLDPADAIGPPMMGSYVPWDAHTSASVAILTLDNPAMGEDGLAVFLSLGNGTLLATPTGVASPRDIAINDGPGGDATATLYVADPIGNQLIDFKLDGTQRAGGNFANTGAGTGVAFSPFGNAGFLGTTMGADLIFFDADDFESNGFPPGVWTTAALDDISGVWGPAPGFPLPNTTRATRMAVRHLVNPLLNALCYFLVSAETTVAAVGVNPATGSPNAGDSGVLATLPTETGTDLLYDEPNDLLIVSATGGTGTGEILVYTAGPSAAMTLVTHTATDAGAFGAFCPAALHLDGSTLYIADVCNDRIVTGDLASDGSSIDFSVGTETPTCAGPLAVASAAAGSVIVVGCPDRIEVHGVD